MGLVKGIYALCPYIAGQWPPACHPPKKTRASLHLHNNRGAMGYGIEAFNDGIPWRGHRSRRWTKSEAFPPTVINVNECDPLRDKGSTSTGFFSPRTSRHAADR